MKIFIAGSMYFAKEMLRAKDKLERLGHKPEVACDIQKFIDDPSFTTDNHEENYKHAVETDIMRKCFDEIAKSDAILLLNYPKNGINGYMGASSIIETGLAYYLKKKIFLLYPPPAVKETKYTHEILIMQPIILNGDLTKIK
jgi:hypothetical protein